MTESVDTFSARKSVRDLHGIEHRPQHVQLELQDVERALLLFASMEVFQRQRQPVLDVAPRLRKPVAEILQSLRVDPWIVLRPTGKAILVDLRREELGKRRAHGLLPWSRAREGDVRIDRETYAGQHALQRRNLVTRKTARHSESYPCLDAALIAFGSVVIDEALDPFAPHRAIGTIGKNRRVLTRNVALIVVAVAHPSLDLPARAVP